MAVPDCECWQEDPEAQEQKVQTIGNGLMYTFQANVVYQNFCPESLPHVAGAVTAGVAAAVATLQLEGEPLSTEDIERALDASVEEARSRIRAAALALMEPGGNA